MDRQDVEKTVTEYLKPIFGFALKRCKTVHDAAWSGDRLQEKRISFEEAATIRPDGAYNIFSASVLRDEKGIPEEYLQLLPTSDEDRRRKTCGGLSRSGFFVYSTLRMNQFKHPL